MVSTIQSRILILLAILVGLLSISATARPCRTFLVSSYSVSFQKSNNPSASSARFITVVSEIRQFNRRPARLRLLPGALPERPIRHHPSFYRDFPSIRFKDTVGVIAALLFGVSCGALTGAVMYLSWSLSYLLNEDSDVEDNFSPKNMGYVKIPTDTQKEAA